MKLKTFTAVNMPAAMQMVKEALGENAVILSSVVNKQTGQVSITAAIEMVEAEPMLKPHLVAQTKPISSNAVRAIETVLRTQHVTEPLYSALLQSALARVPIHDTDEVLTEIIGEHLHFALLDFSQPLRLVLIGPPGVGKTSLIAKIATQLTFQKQKVQVITTDDTRLGAVEQLRAASDMLQMPLIASDNRKDVVQAVQKISPAAHLLIDTTGVNFYSAEEIARLEPWVTLPGVEPVLVMAAGTDSDDAAETAAIAAKTLAPRRMMTTKLDTTRRLGSLLAAACAAKLPLAHFTDGIPLAGHLHGWNAEILSTRLSARALNTTNKIRGSHS